MEKKHSGILSESSLFRIITGMFLFISFLFLSFSASSQSYFYFENKIAQAGEQVRVEVQVGPDVRPLLPYFYKHIVQGIFRLFLIFQQGYAKFQGGRSVVVVEFGKCFLISINYATEQKFIGLVHG